jgi:hypothetical protein
MTDLAVSRKDANCSARPLCGSHRMTPFVVSSNSLYILLDRNSKQAFDLIPEVNRSKSHSLLAPTYHNHFFEDTPGSLPTW